MCLRLLPELLQLLDYLPPSVNFGVRRLTPHFIESGTDVASIWQDGACLFAGLAGPRAALVGPHSYVLVALTCGLGLAATFAWWRFADSAGADTGG